MARPTQAPPPTKRHRQRLSRDMLLPLMDCPARSARLAARRLTVFYDARLAETGLTITQLSLMAQVAGAEDDTLGALADHAGLDPSTLSRNLQTLAREDLVEIVTAGKDQRKRAVWLTEKGARALAAAIPVWAKAQAEAVEVVDVKAMRAIARSTRKLEV